MKKSYDVAVVGATGLVGTNLLNILQKRSFPVGRLVLFAAQECVGKEIIFNGTPIKVIALTGESVIKNRVDIAFFCVDGEISKKYAPLFVALGCTVIDNSSAFRMQDHVPLVIPSVNGSAALINDGIIANPNCSTIIGVSVLAPLYKKYGIKRIIYSTYQSVSGAGEKGIKELEGEEEGVFGKPIKFNVIPKIGDILSTGYTEEEQKMIDETRKILSDDQISVTATAVRVPVYYGHALSINVELAYSVSLSDVIRCIKDAGIVISDYPTPIECAGKGEVFAGRIRRDFSYPNSFNMWVVSDNLLKGAALNAVEIAELLV